MGAQLILGAQQILMVLGAQGAQGAQTMNCTKAEKSFRGKVEIKIPTSVCQVFCFPKSEILFLEISSEIPPATAI